MLLGLGESLEGVVGLFAVSWHNSFLCVLALLLSPLFHHCLHLLPYFSVHFSVLESCFSACVFLFFSASTAGHTYPEPCLWPKVESSSSVSQGPPQPLRVALLLGCSQGCLHHCQGHRGLQTLHLHFPGTLPLLLGLRGSAGWIRCEGCSWSAWFSASTCKHKVMITATVGTWERSCVCFVDAGLKALECQDEVYLVVNLLS